jgi:hypothetical protein
MANVLIVIEPYWHEDTWVFDDASMGLEKEPLGGKMGGELENLARRWLSGTSRKIDYLVKDIPNARSGFMLLISSQPFAGYQVELTRVIVEEVDEKYGGCSYKVKDPKSDWWLSPTLLRYFETTPESLYIKAEPSRAKYDLIKEVVALKGRIEELEQLVGKLTLENESLRKVG